MPTQLPTQLGRRRVIGTPLARAIRKRAGATQSECAAAIGVHRVTFVRWETGAQRPRGEQEQRYLNLLDALELVDGPAS